MYVHGISARAPHMRTSIVTHPQAEERLVAVATVAAVAPRPRTVESRPPQAKAATLSDL
jgi:hypothetical protein